MTHKLFRIEVGVYWPEHTDGAEDELTVDLAQAVEDACQYHRVDYTDPVIVCQPWEAAAKAVTP